MPEPTAYRSNSENIVDYAGFFLLLIAPRGETPPNREQLAALYDGIALREAQTGPSAGLTLPVIRRALELDDCAFFCAAFALCCELDGRLRGAVSSLCGLSVPNFDLALSLYGLLRPCDPVGLPAYADPVLSQLRPVLLLEEGGAQRPLLAAPLTPRRNVLRFFTLGRVDGCDQYRPLSPGDADRPLLHRPVFERAVRYIKEALTEEGGGFFFLRGPAGSGKRTLVGQLCQSLERPCLLLDWEAAAALEPSRLVALACELRADLALSGAVLCVSGVLPGQAGPFDAFLRLLPQTGVALFLLCEQRDAPPPSLDRRPALRSAVGRLTPDDLTVVWQCLCKERPDSAPAEPFEIAHHRLTVGQLRQAWRDAEDLSAADGRTRLLPADLTSAISALSANTAHAARLHSKVRLADVVAEPETLRKLRLACGFVRRARTVRQDWGFDGPASYGRGTTVLLCGASGTGKTMSAAAIANELGLALLRIDLSQVFDKYIGETEKHLASIFETARASDCILFFDEADALFSKRTEISSSHDRYANVETAFLLQGIEQYDGVVLLASNLFGNFDEAFLRRINLVVRFSLPDEALRLTLWRRAFPPRAPLGADVELELLARELELSPSSIQSSAFTAAVLAADEGGPITMERLLSALRGELDKLGQTGRLAALESLTR